MSDQSMKDMAEMLRRGARMLDLNCPECGSPLFQLKTGEIYCPRQKRVVKVVREGEDVDKTTLNSALIKTVDDKIRFIQGLLEAESDPGKIRDLSDTLNSLLNVSRQLSTEKKEK